MTTMPISPAPDRLPLLRFLLSELKPKGPLLTPFNVISIPVILLGIGVLIQRFIYGLGSITNLTQEHPWGLGIGFDVVTGVALAGGAYTLAFAVYVMRLEKYHPIIRATVLNGLLAYIFPRWTPQIRPFVDVSKPAISGRGPRRVSFTP